MTELGRPEHVGGPLGIAQYAKWPGLVAMLSVFLDLERVGGLRSKHRWEDRVNTVCVFVCFRLGWGCQL